MDIYIYWIYIFIYDIYGYIWIYIDIMNTWICIYPCHEPLFRHKRAISIDTWYNRDGLLNVTIS